MGQAQSSAGSRYSVGCLLAKLPAWSDLVLRAGFGFGRGEKKRKRALYVCILDSSNHKLKHNTHYGRVSVMLRFAVEAISGRGY